MGYYVNPVTEEKEDFLDREGQVIALPFRWEDVPKGKLPVILLDNRIFTAAGIAFSAHELNEFQLPDDHRPKRGYLVEVEKLRKVSDLPDDVP